MTKLIKCQDCGKTFEFTESEQKFYEEKGFPQPKRCADCRKARKMRRLNYENK